MGQRVSPFLRLALLCQRVDVGSDRSSTLVGPLHTIALPADLFGTPLDEMYLYAQLEDAVGTFELSVRVEDENQQLVPQTSLQPVTHTFDRSTQDPTIPYALVLRLNRLVFPAPGVYHFIVRCDGDSRSLHQRDGAARAPFLRILRSN